MDPAGIVTVPPAGTAATAGSLELTVTRVSVAAMALSVRVKLAEAPGATSRAAGVRPTRLGPLGNTVTVHWKLLAFRVAVIVAVPGAMAATGITTETDPARTVTVGGTVATARSLLKRVITVSADWTALSVTVRLAVPPAGTVRDDG
jgi:hypothetical protein